MDFLRQTYQRSQKILVTLEPLCVHCLAAERSCDDAPSWIRECCSAPSVGLCVVHVNDSAGRRSSRISSCNHHPVAHTGDSCQRIQLHFKNVFFLRKELIITRFRSWKRKVCKGPSVGIA